MFGGPPVQGETAARDALMQKARKGTEQTSRLVHCMLHLIIKSQLSYIGSAPKSSNLKRLIVNLQDMFSTA